MAAWADWRFEGTQLFKHRGLGLGLASLMFLACSNDDGNSSTGAGGTGSAAGTSAAGGLSGVGATRATGGSAVAGSNLGSSTGGSSTIVGSTTGGSRSSGGANATNVGGSSPGASGGAGTAETSSVAGAGNVSGTGNSAGTGGSGGNSSSPSYAVVVQTTDLLSSGLVLQLNGGSNLSPAPGTTTPFATKLTANATYTVTVLTQPNNPQQICKVKGATGTIAADTSVSVTCTQLARYYLAVDVTDKSISTYLIDEPSGRSTYVGKMATEKVPGLVVVHPTGKYAYVLNTSDSTLSQYTINPDGSLTSLGADVSAGTGARSITLDPTGARVYVTTSSNVLRFAIDEKKGTLGTSQAETVSGATLGQIAFHPSGKSLYVVDTGNGTGNGSVVQCAVNATDGALTLGATIAAGKSPSAIVMDGDGRSAFVVNSGSNNVSQYSVGDDGSLTSIAAAPTVPVGTKPVAMVLDPRARYAYVVNAESATVSQLKLSQGVLSASGASTVGTEPNPSGILVSPTGNYLYVANTTGNSVSQFTVASDGTLAANVPPRVPAQLSPSSLGMVTGTSYVKQFGRFAYVANGDADSVSLYTINHGTGALGGFTTKSIEGGGPNTVVVDPTATRAYVVNGFGNTITQYTIEGTGALAAIGGTGNAIGTGTKPTAMAVHPSNRFAYVTNSLDNSISHYTIEPNGALKAVPSATYTSTDFRAPNAIALDPSGRSAYVATLNGKIAQFAVGSNGVLTAMTPLSVAAGGQPTSIGISPDARYLYAVNSLDDTVSQYRIQASGPNQGALEPVASPNTVATGTLPLWIALDPTGRYAYVANASSANVSQYEIASGALSLLSPATVAAGSVGTSSPYAIGVDPSGQYAYAVDHRESASVIWQYKLSANVLGALEPMSPPSVPAEAFGRSFTIVPGRE